LPDYTETNFYPLTSTNLNIANDSLKTNTTVDNSTVSIVKKRSEETKNNMEELLSNCETDSIYSSSSETDIEESEVTSDKNIKSKERGVKRKEQILSVPANGRESKK
jgi:hypothetical protein